VIKSFIVDQLYAGRLGSSQHKPFPRPCFLNEGKNTDKTSNKLFNQIFFQSPATGMGFTNSSLTFAHGLTFAPGLPEYQRGSVKFD